VGVKGLCLAAPPRSRETSRPDSRDPGRMVARKARQNHAQESVQGSGS
jgi:hypothetical protein